MLLRVEKYAPQQQQILSWRAKSDQTFELLDQSEGANGNRLYFYKTNESELRFDRNRDDHDNCHMELYKKRQTTIRSLQFRDTRKLQNCLRLQVARNI